MRKFSLKTWFVRAAAIMVVPALMLIAACSEDEPKIDPVTVEFNSEGQASGENEGVKTVSIKLSGAAQKDGTVTVTITSTAAYGTAYTTNPAGTSGSFEIAITKGQTGAQFTVTPQNNALIDGDKAITFTLSEGSSGFVVGTKKTHAFTITDDEGPTSANFAAASATIAEGSTTGIEVVINLSREGGADAAGTIEVTYAPLTDVFTATPAVGAEKITVPVAIGDQSVKFTIVPKDNPTTEDHVVTFTIANTTGGVAKGTALTYALTIEDDDAIELMSIADVRALFTGTSLPITQSIKIEGVVISSSANTTQRNFWIHDGTAGLLLRLNANHSFVLGDKLEVVVKGSTLQEFNGTLQIGNNDLANDKASKIGTGELPAYKTITVAQLVSDEYEGELVQIVDAKFEAADGIRNFNYNSGLGIGNNEFTVGTDRAVFRVENYATFRATPLPLGTGTLRGIASEYTTTSTIFQVSPQSASDFFETNPSATLTISKTDIDFGDVQKGETADDQFTISGTDLIADATVAVTGANYQVSLDGTTFGNQVSVPFASANASPVTVHVRFTANLGVDQTLTGSVQVSAAGAIAKVVQLTGKEKGNAPATGTLMIYEIYGGGGNSGALYNNDYVVLYNGTASAIDLSNYSLHYASAANAFGIINNSNLSGTINAGDYFLIQLAPGATVTDKPLPTPDLAPTLHGNAAQIMNLSGTAGKISLATGPADTAITGKTDPRVVDYVGFGTTASDFEGTGRAPAPSNSTSIKRVTFVDTNNNDTDFAVVTPNLGYLN